MDYREITSYSKKKREKTSDQSVIIFSILHHPGAKEFVGILGNTSDKKHPILYSKKRFSMTGSEHPRLQAQENYKTLTLQAIKDKLEARVLHLSSWTLF